MEKPPKDSFYVTFGIYGAVGFQLAISVVAGLYLGKWGDKKLGTDPWLMILGVALGAVVGFYNLIKLMPKKGE